MNERFTYVKPRVAFAKDGVEDHKTGKIFDFTIDNALDIMNELSKREERLLSEIDDFQELLSKNDNICHDRVVNLIEDKIAFLYVAKADMINEDSYRLKQISFAITVLNELKKELKGDDDD